MKYLLTGVAAIALLTACGKKDEPGATDASPAAIEKEAKNIKAAAGDPATAGDALAALSLAGGASDAFAFDSSNVDGDKATFSNVTILTDELSDEGDGTKIVADSIVFDGLGMFDGKANFSHMTISNLTMTAAEVDAGEEGSGSVKSIELINPSPELAAWVSAVVAGEDPGDLPEGDALSFDKWSVDDVVVSMKEGNAKSGSFKIDDLQVVGFDAERMDGLTVSSLSMQMVDPSEDMDLDLNIGSMTLQGLDKAMFGEMMDSMDDPGFAAGARAGLSGPISADDPASPGFDGMSLKDMTAKVSGVNLDIDELSSIVSRDKQGRATKISTKPFTIHLTTGEGELGTQLAAGLAAMGYEEITLKGASEQIYDPETDMMTMPQGKNYYELTDGFKLNMSGKYQGTKAIAAAQQAGDDLDQMPQEQLQTMMESFVLHNLKIELDDDGIVDRGFNAYATMNGQDPQQLRNQAAGMMAMAPMMAGGAGIDPAIASEVATALSGFLTDPKTLTIELAPESPLVLADFAEMDDPSAITKAKLGLSASNK